MSQGTEPVSLLSCVHVLIGVDHGFDPRCGQRSQTKDYKICILLLLCTERRIQK